VAITWETLLRRRGNASLIEYAAGRGITSYDQLCGSFRAHGLTPPTRQEAADFLADQTGSGGKGQAQAHEPKAHEPAPSFEEPIADILYEAPKPVKKKSKSKKKRGK
jgi:hypothetical protein